VIPKVTLDETCIRATPHQWSSSSAITIRIIQNNEPLMLNTQIRKNMYNINAGNPHKPHFFDFSKHKIGKQCVSNRILPIFKSVCFPWYNLNLSRDSIRVGLKKSFFPYYWQKCKIPLNLLTIINLWQGILYLAYIIHF